ncbi:MAG: hypothetical protein JXA95_07930 [Spirochaetales bacterium]|nr:hypothetical protein [Spirochaetales bacterium]
MVIFRKSDHGLILHDPLTHIKRCLSSDEKDTVFRFIPQLQDPHVESWLITDLPQELLHLCPARS